MMKTKRSVLTIAIVCVCAFTFAACGQPAEETPLETSAQQTEAPTEAAAPSETEAPAEATAPDVTEMPVEEPVATAALPEVAEVVTLTTLGEITDIMDEQDQIHLVGWDEANPANDVVINITDDTVLYDAQSGRFIDDDALRVGDMAQVTLGSTMTFSLPPISNGLLITVNPPDDMMGLPIYTEAAEVTRNDDGSATVLNQNRDTYVTIPAGLTVEVRDNEGETEAADVTPAEIKKGDVLLTWYDFVATSHPAQATATRVVLVVDD